MSRTPQGLGRMNERYVIDPHTCGPSIQTSDSDVGGLGFRLRNLGFSIGCIVGLGVRSI